MYNNCIKWARVTKVGINGQQFFTQQIEYLGKKSDAILAFPYGFHANASEDSLALSVCVQNSQDNKAIIAWDAKNRPDLNGSEVAVYHPPTQAKIVFKENGDIDISTGLSSSANINIMCGEANIKCSGDCKIEASNVDITSSQTNISGNLSVGGLINGSGGASITGSMMNNGKDIGDGHSHAQGPDSDGNAEQNITGVL